MIVSTINKVLINPSIKKLGCSERSRKPLDLYDCLCSEAFYGSLEGFNLYSDRVPLPYPKNSIFLFSKIKKGCNSNIPFPLPPPLHSFIN